VPALSALVPGPWSGATDYWLLTKDNARKPGLTGEGMSVFPGRRGGRRQAGHGGTLGDLAVAQGAEHFEHLAPGGERPPVVALVLVHRLHEDDFLVAVVALAGGGVDLPAAFAALAPVLAAAAIHGDGDVPLPTVPPAAVARPAVSDQDVREHGFFVTHGAAPRCGTG